MDTYIYLLISVLFFIPFFIIYILRKDLRNRLIKSGLIVAPFGFVNLWFRADYWAPPEIFKFHYLMTIEDVLVTLVTTSLGATLFDSLFTKTNEKFTVDRSKITVFFPVAILILFFILGNLFGIMSMYMFYLTITIVSTYILMKRIDLILPFLVSGILLGIISVCVYFILFNYISPDYWKKYWFLAGTKHDITFLGNIPLLEILWYFFWGAFAGSLYDFARGTKKVYNKLGILLFGKIT